jgi:hypothetical protein
MLRTHDYLVQYDMHKLNSKLLDMGIELGNLKLGRLNKSPDVWTKWLDFFLLNEKKIDPVFNPSKLDRVSNSVLVFLRLYVILKTKHNS